VRFVSDERTNSLLVTSASHHFPVIEKLIADLDKEEPQVLIRVRILEVARGKTKKLGLRWTADEGLFTQEDKDAAIGALSNLDLLDVFGGWAAKERSITDTFSGSGGSLTRTDSSVKYTDTRRGIIGANVNLSLLLQMLIKNLDTNIIIQPDLYVSNNQTGKIFVGENLPRLVSIEDIGNEGKQREKYENEDIGVTMEVMPKISKNGVVVMNVSLMTSQRTGEQAGPSDVLQKREYQTEVAIKGGETMVLGGIRLSNKQKIVRKFPVLGYIPILGYLFQNHDTSDKVTDLYAFITPTVITNDEEARELTERIRGSVIGFEDMFDDRPQNGAPIDLEPEELGGAEQVGDADAEAKEEDTEALGVGMETQSAPEPEALLNTDELPEGSGLSE